MRFFDTAFIAALSLTSHVSALPASVEERQAVTVTSVTTLNLNLGAIINTITTELATIIQTIQGVEGHTTSQGTTLIGQITPTITGITTQLDIAGQSLGTTLPALTATLTAADVTGLTSILNTVKTFIVAIDATAAAVQGALTGATQAAASAEMKGATTALTTVLTPLLTYVASVENASAIGAAGAVTGLKAAAGGLSSTTGSLLSNLALPALTITGL